jgi:dolichyl-diphosphooligosaccharide--protein glycosyltransferase
MSNTNTTSELDFSLLNLNRMESDPDAVHVRSEDGRGPLFWAYEQGNEQIIQMLINAGVDETQRDAQGNVAKDMGQ